MVWEALNKAVEKHDIILSMVMEIGYPSEPMRALTRLAAEADDAATYQAERIWRPY